MRSRWSCNSLTVISAMGFDFGLGIALKPGGAIVFLVRVGEVGDCGLLALIGPIVCCEEGLERNIREDYCDRCDDALYTELRLPLSVR